MNPRTPRPAGQSQPTINLSVFRRHPAGATVAFGLFSERTITIREARVPDTQNRRGELDQALYDRKGNLVMAERTRSRLAAIEAFAGSAGGMNEASQPE